MDHPISQKVMSWFKARYGDRLNLDLDFGHSVLLMRGDILRFRCPRFYGRVYVLLCRTNAGTNRSCFLLRTRNQTNNDDCALPYSWRRRARRLIRTKVIVSLSMKKKPPKDLLLLLTLAVMILGIILHLHP